MNEDQETSALRGRIARARVRQASRRRNLFWGLTGAGFLVAVIGAGVWLASQLVGHSPPGPSLVDSVPAEPPDVESPPVRPESGPAQSVDPAPAESGDIESPPARTVSEPAPPGDSPGDVAQAQVDALLHRLETALLSIPAATAPRPDFDAAVERIRLAREKALEAHRDGDSESALRLLSGAAQEAEEWVRREEARFRIALQAGRDAYAAGNASDARMHIAQALRQRPDDSEAKRWEARIAHLPELLAERRKAEDARVAGRLREERAALRRIVVLDPEDAGARERVAAIDRELREQAFARAVAQGRQAVENRALEPAKQALAEAHRLGPEHADTQQLRTEVAALERTLDRDGHLAAAEQAAGRDDWEAALAAFEAARAIEPTHDAAVSGSGLATRVVQAQRAVDEFLSRPERLGAPRVADAARDALRRAAALTALSPRLTNGAAGLERAIEAARTPVPVLIVSDEETEIGIRGIGTVGRVRERTIDLLPGQYVFEGKRRGYRSKLVDVVVQANLDAPVEVRIVCDERS